MGVRVPNVGENNAFFIALTSNRLSILSSHLERCFFFVDANVGDQKFLLVVVRARHRLCSQETWPEPSIFPWSEFVCSISRCACAEEREEAEKKGDMLFFNECVSSVRENWTFRIVKIALFDGWLRIQVSVLGLIDLCPCWRNCSINKLHHHVRCLVKGSSSSRLTSIHIPLTFELLSHSVSRQCWSFFTPSRP